MKIRDPELKGKVRSKAQNPLFPKSYPTPTHKHRRERKNRLMDNNRKSEIFCTLQGGKIISFYFWKFPIRPSSHDQYSRQNFLDICDLKISLYIQTTDT